MAIIVAENQLKEVKTGTTTDRFNMLKEKVLSRKPVLRHIIDKHGDKMLYDYARQYIEVNVNPPIKRRQDELIGCIEGMVTRQFDASTGQAVATQLKKYYFVSTTDHHGPICHPFFLNGNLISSAAFYEHPDPELSHLIVLSCSNVSLNNSSFPRGLLFHSNLKNTQDMQRLSFFPASDRLCPVYGYRPYTLLDLKRVKDEIRKKHQGGEITALVADKLAHIIDTVYASPKAITADTYGEQVGITNQALWQKFFAPNHATAPSLIYLEQERVVAELLMDYHLGHNTIISNILFNPRLEPLMHHYFQGIRGAFSLDDKSGTYLFWALPKGQKYRKQLWKRNNELTTEDGSYRIPLEPEAISSALQSGELIPSMLLTFIVLSFYYGLKCLGGFSQVNYLTFMKRAYVKMMADLESYKSIEVCARVQTKELCGEVTLAFLADAEKRLMPATGLDLILYGNEFTWSQFVTLSKHISVAEALNPLMSEFYKIIYPETKRDPNLASLTPEEITHLTGLDKKIKPCATLS